MNAAKEKLEKVESLISNTDLDYFSISKILIDLTLMMKTDHHRLTLNQNHWLNIAKLCKVGTHFLSKIYPTRDEIEVVAHLFRFLRNACAVSGKNHQFILNSAEVFEFAKMPLSTLVNKESHDEIIVVRICVQLFGNMLVLSDESKPSIWQLFFKEGALKNLLCSTDYKVLDYTMMVLFNLMSDENCKEVLTTSEGHEIVKSVLTSNFKSFNDCGMLFMECLLKRDNFMVDCYNSLPLENRLMILDLIIEQLKWSEEKVFIPVASIKYLKNRFLTLVKEIAELCNSCSNTDPSEFVQILSLLSAASVNNTFIPFMLSCKDLLQTSIDTLKCVHLLGKDSNNEFSSIPSLQAELNHKITEHPLFCFKKDLIKLIGNLCHDCKENQDLVRSADGIPLILDCSKLDAKNPYIMQWCILAIRNLVDQNEENKAILAGITTTKEFEDSPFLKEIGINVRLKDGKPSLEKY